MHNVVKSQKMIEFFQKVEKAGVFDTKFYRYVVVEFQNEKATGIKIFRYSLMYSLNVPEWEFVVARVGNEWRFNI